MQGVGAQDKIVIMRDSRAKYELCIGFGLPVSTIGPKVWLTPGSISVAVDRLERKALVKRKNTDDRRVRLVELTAKGRPLIAKTFREHAAAMEEAAEVLAKEERLTLLRLLKKLGKGGEDESLAAPQ